VCAPCESWHYWAREEHFGSFISESCICPDLCPRVCS
jgi:hypothetical protein